MNKSAFVPQKPLFSRQTVFIVTLRIPVKEVSHKVIFHNNTFYSKIHFGCSLGLDTTLIFFNCLGKDCCLGVIIDMKEQCLLSWDLLVSFPRSVSLLPLASSIVNIQGYIVGRTSKVFSQVD